MNQEELNKRLADHVQWRQDPSAGKRLDLSGEDLFGLNLTRADLAGADLTGADLSDANLSYTVMSRAKLSYAIMTGAIMTGADLSDANLSYTVMYRAHLSRAIMTGTNMDYASWPLWCGSLKAKADEDLCAQLAYHLARLMQNSGVTVGAEIADLANKAPQIKRYDLPKIGE